MQTGSAFVENFDELVARLCKEYASDLQSPYALLGHSMGALLAYGIAQYQYARFKPLPKMIFACASPAPAQRKHYPLAEIHDQKALIAELRLRGGAPEDVLQDPEMLQHTLGILAADYRVVRSFEYSEPPRLPLPIHVFAGRRDEIKPEHVEAWREETSAHSSVHWFDGGHFFLRSQPERLIEHVVRALRPVRTGFTPAVASSA
jgi:surfactin synthase thioesterase subunit